jgi:hypothetical protein
VDEARKGLDVATHGECSLVFDLEI